MVGRVVWRGQIGWGSLGFGEYGFGAAFSKSSKIPKIHHLQATGYSEIADMAWPGTGATCDSKQETSGAEAPYVYEMMGQKKCKQAPSERSCSTPWLAPCDSSARVKTALSTM